MIEKYRLTKNNSLRPDVISFTSTIKAWVGHIDGGSKALEILNEMYKQHENGNIRAIPDTKALSIAMDACVRSNLLEDASRILDSVDDKQKSRVMFNTLISAYKFSGQCEEAETLLRKMKILSNNGFSNCSPDSTTYAMCISAVSLLGI